MPEGIKQLPAATGINSVWVLRKRRSFIRWARQASSCAAAHPANWWSISKQQRRSAWRCRNRCAEPPTRWSN